MLKIMSIDKLINYDLYEPLYIKVENGITESYSNNIGVYSAELIFYSDIGEVSSTGPTELEAIQTLLEKIEQVYRSLLKISPGSRKLEFFKKFI